LRVGGRSATFRRRRQPRALKPALQGALSGNGFLGLLAMQENTDQTGAPGGVLAAKTQGFVQEVPGYQCGPMGTAGVRRSDQVSAANPKAAQQVTHRAGNQAEGLRDGRNALPLFGPLSDYLTQWKRDRMWHEQSSLEQDFNRETHGMLSRDFTCYPSCRQTAKPAVGISRQNYLSHLSGKSRVVFKRQNLMSGDILEAPAIPPVTSTLSPFAVNSQRPLVAGKGDTTVS
jgi:hypothetical protein